MKNKIIISMILVIMFIFVLFELRNKDVNTDDIPSVKDDSTFEYVFIGTQSYETEDNISVSNRYEVEYLLEKSELKNISVYTSVDSTNDNSNVNITEFEIINRDGAAGTSYMEFKFVGTEKSTNKEYKGSGILAVSTDGVTYALRLKLDFEEPLLVISKDGKNVNISASSNEYVELVNEGEK